MPRELLFVEPMDCKLVASLPSGEDWQYEIKFDGYRAIAIKQRGEVQVFSRRGKHSQACREVRPCLIEIGPVRSATDIDNAFGTLAFSG